MMSAAETTTGTTCACGQQLAEVRVEDGGLVGYEPDGREHTKCRDGRTRIQVTVQEPRLQTHDDFDDGDSLMRPSFYDRGLA